MDEKDNLIQLFMSGGENMSLAFEINKSRRILSAKEIEWLLRKFLKQQGGFVRGENITAHNIAKKYKLFPLWRKLCPLKKRVYVSNKRILAHNAVLCTEWQCRLFSRRQYIEAVSRYFEWDIHSWSRDVGIVDKIFFIHSKMQYISWLMQVRITNHIEDECAGAIFEDWGDYFDTERESCYIINNHYKEYIALRKQYGYISEPISNVFK